MNKRINHSDYELAAYFKQIKNISLLTFEEELSLSKRIQKGDEAARQKLIESNLRLVVKIAKEFVTRDVHFIDLIQEGNLGLIKAVSKYDHRKNVRFSTYAAWWIKQSIVRALSNKKRVIRLPHRKEESIKRIQKAFSVLSQQLQHEPSVSEIANEVGMKEDEVERLLGVSHSVASLDSAENLENGCLLDFYEDETFNPDRQLMEKSLKHDTMQFLEHLLEREKKILMYRYSFYQGKKFTLKSIGEEMGISPETVRQIEIRALKKLKEHSDEIRDYVYH